MPLFTDYYVTIYGEPDPAHPYCHGHIDGAFSGDPEVYQEIIPRQVELQELQRRIAEAENKKVETRRNLERVIELEAEIAGRRCELDQKQERLDEARKNEKQAIERLKELEAQEKETRGKGSLLHIWVYTLAGVFFFAGDIIVSYQVVAQVLRLGEGASAQLERWVFAFAIAFITIAYKAMYDRLIEKPYWQDKQVYFKRFIFIMTVGVLLTLGLLGYLRAYQTNAVEQSKKTDFTLSLDIPANQTALQQTEENGVVERWILPIGFILTTVLFPITGAMAFGIATQHWEGYRHVRRPLNRLIGIKDGKPGENISPHTPIPIAIRYHRKHQETEQAEVIRLTGEISRNENERRSLPTIPALLETLNRLETEQADNYERLTAARTALHTLSYRSGYHLAKENLSDLPNFSHKPGNLRPARSNGRPSTGGKGERRPFLWVRDEIIYNSKLDSI